MGETSIKRPQDRSLNRSLFAYAVTVVLLTMSTIKKISGDQMFLMLEPLMNMILRMMPRLLPSVNKRKKLTLDYSSKKKMSKTLLRKRLTKKKETKKKQMMMLFPLDDRILKGFISLLQLIIWRLHENVCLEMYDLYLM